MQYSYNDDGTLHSKTDALGQQTQYTYDALARVTQVSYLPNGLEDVCQRATYSYDKYHVRRRIPPALKKRMQGKTRFNFKSEPEPESIAALTQLTEAAFQQWREQKWV